ncbi:hypothetical protein BH23GEM6_BH23GEM6_27420 [soil metagenome]
MNRISRIVSVCPANPVFALNSGTRYLVPEDRDHILSGRDIMLRIPLLVTLLFSACAVPPQTRNALAPVVGEQEAFWNGLLELCGRAFAGTAIHVPESDSAFVDQRLVMHVSHCGEGEILIPFSVGEDRSRTWVLRKTGAGLELKHIHRYQDGTASSNTDYGGTARSGGTPHRQEFPADAYSVAAVAGRVSQWWFLEHYRGHLFAYGLFRQETGMHYRIEFDLSRSVAIPPASW